MSHLKDTVKLTATHIMLPEVILSPGKGLVTPHLAGDMDGDRRVTRAMSKRKSSMMIPEERSDLDTTSHVEQGRGVGYLTVSSELQVAEPVAKRARRGSTNLDVRRLNIDACHTTELCPINISNHSLADQAKDKSHELDLDGTSLSRWNNDERRILTKLAKRFEYKTIVKGKPGVAVKWDSVVEVWKREHSTCWKYRSILSIKKQHTRLRKSGEIVNFEEITFGDDSLDNQLAADLGDEDRMIDISELVEQETNLDKQTFRLRFEPWFRKAMSNAERVPFGRINRSIKTEWIEWANDLVEEKLRINSKSDQLLVLTSALYAVGKTLKLITSVVPQAFCKNRHSQIETLERRACKIRTELSHLAQELERRKVGRKPTPRQIRILHALRKANLSETDELESGYLNRKESLTKIKIDLQVQKDELSRRRVRAGPVGGCFKTKQETVDRITPAQVRNFWKPIAGTVHPFVKSPELEDWAASLKTLPAGAAFDIGKAWDEVLRKAKSWKAAGPDGVQSFWWKNIRVARVKLLEIFTGILNGSGPIRLGKWFCAGRVVSIYKKGNPADPGNYRPITCLNTSFKLLTGLIAIQCRAAFENALPKQQLALRKGMWGCTHAHAVDQALTQDVRSDSRGKRACHVGWVDYAKAFDSVPHAAIQWSMKIAGFDKRAIDVYSALMSKWSVRYEVRTDRGIAKSSPMRIRNGVLQGDSLSPMLFCLAIAPISHFLEQAVLGYELRAKVGEDRKFIRHLFYVDDLKIYARDMDDLDRAFDGVKRVSGYLNLKVNDSKCAKGSIASKACQSHSLDSIPYLGMKDTYTYLGIEQGLKGNSLVLFERLRANALGKAKIAWESELTLAQKVRATNSCVMPILNYGYINSFTGTGTFDSSRAAATQVDKAIIRILSDSRAKYAKTSCERLYLPTSEGGLGLVSARDSMENSVVYAFCYLLLTEELGDAYEALKRARQRTKRSVLSDMITLLQGYDGIDIGELPLSGQRIPWSVHIGVGSASTQLQFANATVAARAIVSQLTTERTLRRVRKWESSTHQSRIRFCKHLDLSDSWKWIQIGHLNTRTVSEIFAVQEGQLFTRSHPGSTGSRRCRHCGDPLETVVHVVSGCSQFRQTIMMERHDAVARQLHYALCVMYGLKPPHFRQRIPTRMSNDLCEISWNHRYDVAGIRCNNPDLVVFDKQANRMTIADVSVVWYDRIPLVEQLKTEKYSVNGTLDDDVSLLPFPRGPNLAGELSKLHAASAHAVPIVIGTCGETTKGLRSALRELSFDESKIDSLIPRLQRSAVIGTAWVLRAHLSRGGQY